MRPPSNLASFAVVIITVITEIGTKLNGKFTIVSAAEAEVDQDGPVGSAKATISSRSGALDRFRAINGNWRSILSPGRLAVAYRMFTTLDHRTA